MTTYAEKLELAGSAPATFIHLFPRLYFRTGWTLHSGSAYYRDFNYTFDNVQCYVFEATTTFGYSSNVARMAALTPETSIANVVSSPGTYFFDKSTNRLYLRSLQSVNPNNLAITVEHMLLVSTHGGHIPINIMSPEDSSNYDVYYEPYIIKPPLFKQSLSDQVYGYLPAESSSVLLSNTTHWFEKHAYESQFLNARANVYVDWQVKNPINFNKNSYGINSTQLMSRQIIGTIETLSLDDTEVTVNIKSPVEVLDKKPILSKFNTYSWTSVKADDANKYIRKIYGRVKGFIPINVDYNATPTTSNNRKWVVSADSVASHPVLNTAINTGGTNNATQTTVVSAAGFMKGDSIIIDQGGTPTYGHFISDVNYTTNVITHTSIGVRVVSPGDTVKRGFISSIQITDSDSDHWLAYGRDWTETNENGFAEIVLANNFEANHGALTSPFDPDSMSIRCAVNGLKSVPTNSLSNAIGAVANKSGAYCNPVGLVHTLFTDAARSFFDGIMEPTSFDTLADSVDQLVGFAIPETNSGSPATYKTYVINLLNSFHGRIYSTGDGDTKIGITKIAPTGNADFILKRDEILSFSYEPDFRDMPSEIILGFENMEVAQSDYNGITPINYGSSVSDDNRHFFYSNGPIARWAMDISKTIEIDTYLWDTEYSSANPVSDINRRYTYVFRERRGLLTVTVKNRFLAANIGDTIEIERDALPGYDFIYGQLQSKKFVLIEKTFSTDKLTLVLDDQKGIEDNSGSW